MAAPRIHHLSCATMCPPLARAAVNPRGYMCCHCLLIESPGGLILVDTGLGTGDVEAPRARLGRGFLAFAGPVLRREECAIEQVQKLGFRAADVRHIVVTHLDLDHAGGLSDFPDASVHILDDEHHAAMARATVGERERYRPAHWAHNPKWVQHQSGGEGWLGFEAVRALDKAWPEVLIVPLRGHTRGHAGIAVRRGEGWLLHAGDAYFHASEVTEHPRCPAVLRAFQRIVAVDDRQRRANQERLRSLARDRGSEVRIFCAHDPDELDAAAEHARRIVS